MVFGGNADLRTADFRASRTRGIWANAQIFQELGSSGVAKIALVIGVPTYHTSIYNQVMPLGFSRSQLMRASMIF